MGGRETERERERKRIILKGGDDGGDDKGPAVTFRA